MEYKLSGKITFNDYIQFNKYFSKNSIFGKSKLLIYLLVLCIILVLVISDLNILIEIYKSSPFNLMKIFIPLLILIFISIIYRIFIEPIISKYVFNKNKIFKVLQNNHNIKINEKSVIIETIEYNKILTKLDKINIKYSNNTIYIFNGFILELIINNRFIENENMFDEIVKFIKLNYGKK
jgi:hypothetical protein